MSMCTSILQASVVKAKEAVAANVRDGESWCTCPGCMGFPLFSTTPPAISPATPAMLHSPCPT
jgi:hypothetical protein